jgi:HlyD family secretion protein
MKKKILIGGIIVVVLAVIVILNITKAKGGGSKHVVQTSKVKTGEIVSKISAPGKVKTVTEVKVSANLMGKVVRLPVKEGDKVKKGQVLVVLDAIQYQAQVAQARAALEQAKASLSQSETLVQRKKELYDKGLISKEEWEAIQTQHAVNQAQVRQAESNLAQTADWLSKTTLTSPINGVVTQLNVELGEVVVTGTMNQPGTVIMMLGDMGEMEVEADVDETDMKDILVGQPTEIKVDALKDTVLTGVVTTVGNAAVAKANLGGVGETVSFTVKTSITNPPPNLRPGMSATVKIQTAQKDSVLYLPIQCVVVRQVEMEKREAERREAMKKGKIKKGAADNQDEESKEKEQEAVYVVEKGIAHLRPVKTGIADETNQEILSGVKAGEEVIRGPFKELLKIRESDKVKVDNSKLKLLTEKK